MATTPATIKGSPRGISNTLTGFVVENETITPSNIQEDFDDQNGARADEQEYDHRIDLKLTVYLAEAPASNSSIQAKIDAVIVAMPTGYTGKRIKYPSTGNTWYKVDSVEEAGTYNGRRRWNIIAHKYDNFPPQTSS